MAASQNGHVNGINGHYEHNYDRFSEVPPQIDIPVRGEDGDEVVEFTLEELQDDIDELCGLLESENAAKNYWITIALAYAKQNKVNIAIELLQRALGAQNSRPAKPEDKLSIMVCLCWMFLWKCRHAPRVKPSQQTEDDRTKDYFLHQATSILNDASRISPSHPPLNLARGTLYLLRASLQPYKAGNEHSERAETLKQAAKCFDAAYKTSGAKNVMAMLGKARAQFSLGRFAEALALYQQTLEKAPDMFDPDPRIGIGCCLWQLGYKGHAKSAWQRSLELNENSKIAHVLLGLCYLDESGQYPTTDSEFAKLYKKAMTEHTQTAFKLDAMHAMTCAVFGSYFVLRKAWANVERLARRAIEQTDVNAVASDGWYLLARKEHYEGDMAKAADYYAKADQARGGDERGHLPAKFGAAQLKTLMKDFDGAKFRLEKMISNAGQNQKNLEAMTLLGILYAEDVFANQAAGGKEDKSAEHKKAIGLLEGVRIAWKDPKRKASPDSAVLLNLARLYEQEAPDRALACLQQVEKMEVDDIADDDERLPDEMGDAQEEERAKRELLSPQLLNNIGCFHFQASQYTQAREDFQTALNSCVKMGERDEAVDTDALVTSISYNLARTYEAEGLNDEAKKVYQGLLERHPDYIDANSRLAYISLNTEPEAGAKAVKELLDSDPANLEVRALYGWYLNRHKKRTNQLNEDQEQRHYKHTLQNYDKHDLYSLTGMGNLHLQVAREMRRETDQDKERRSKTYMRAVEFFDKVLTLDPKNAFAAQGLGIAMVEDKRDTAAGIQVFSKVRESLKGASASVHINLGHVFAETRQWSRSIENYEMALAKSIRDTGKADAQILACLGRVWLMRGRQEKKLEAYKTALDMSKQALELAKDNISFRFNVAFVQIQLATLLAGLSEAQRTLLDVEEVSAGLEAAIDTFSDIAKNPNAPFPRGDLEARANMGRNTMRKQLSAAVEKQREYETKNASRIAEAKRKREEEIARREEEKRKAAAEADEQRRRIAEERERIAQEDRELIRRRMEEEKAREEAEYTTDPETGERKKREKKPKEKRQKRKKKGDDSDSDGLGLDSDVDGGTKKGRKSRATSTPATGDDEEAPRRKKKRKLERKGQATKTNAKYKSSEMVEDSSDDDGDGIAAPNGGARDVATPGAADEDQEMVDEEEAAVAKASQRKRGNRVVDDEDEDEEGGVGQSTTAPAAGAEEDEE
ncbi:tetratricopeptide repeat protein 1-like [Teratosphaeria destructans]|uniref:Tetratricopeptide repeat protein 1-like n=1 Tax=Teratosphaeria destructans TaxID=418781 RepID=A0A9W7W5Q9_9PEZI|nr:tetratricopeptide repeat protein 1-like [Teratosphaeria destructans]